MYDERKYNVFIIRLLSNKIETKSWNIINENCVEHHYNEKFEDIIESTNISEITAIFTAANARIRLYSLLEWLDPSHFIYSDTDSCFILYDINNPKHQYPSNDTPKLPANVRLGNALGQWEDELKGGWITEFVGGGAKSYAYKKNDGTINMKQKGITLDMNNRAEITYDRFKDLSLNWNKLIEEEVITKTGVETY